MSTSPWKDLPKFLPDDGSTVWVSPSNSFSAPYKAQWVQTDQSFIAIDTALVAPWWTIVRWKPI